MPIRDVIEAVERVQSAVAAHAVHAPLRYAMPVMLPPGPSPTTVNGGGQRRRGSFRWSTSTSSPDAVAVTLKLPPSAALMAAAISMARSSRNRRRKVDLGIRRARGPVVTVHEVILVKVEVFVAPEQSQPPARVGVGVGGDSSRLTPENSRLTAVTISWPKRAVVSVAMK